VHVEFLAHLHVSEGLEDYAVGVWGAVGSEVAPPGEAIVDPPPPASGESGIGVDEDREAAREGQDVRAVLI